MKMAQIVVLAMLAGFSLIYAPIALQSQLAHAPYGSYNTNQGGNSLTNGTIPQTGVDSNKNTSIGETTTQASSPLTLYGEPSIVAGIGITAALLIYLIARKGLGAPP